MAISLAGLSATYPGYSAQETATAKADETRSETQANQSKAREAAIKILGSHALGSALIGVNPGPQAPPPGQASVPAPGPMPQGAPPVPPPPAGVTPPASGPAVAPAASVPPAAAADAGKSPEMTLEAVTARLLQVNPGLRNHPEIFLAALDHAKPFLDAQAKADLKEIQQKFALERLDIARQRLKEAHEMHENVSLDRGASADLRKQAIDLAKKKLDKKAADTPTADTPVEAPPVIAPASAQAAGVTAPPTAGNVPPIATLKPNVVTTFANGQKWTVGPDGKPKQVQ